MEGKKPPWTIPDVGTVVVRSLHLSEGNVDDIRLRNTQLQKTEVILVRHQGWVTCGENPC